MSSHIFVSVVVPVRNEETLIARCLTAILNQDYPRDSFEIIVADGLSNDRTLEVIRALSGAESIRIIRNPQCVQSAGLNVAIQEARGDIVIRVDGHTIIAPDYVRQCVAALQETAASVVGGTMDPVGITLMGKAIASATKTRFAVPGAFHIGTTSQYTDTVYMGAWPRWIFDRIGGFDEQLSINEDYELNYRIRQMGGKVYLSSSIHSQYFGRQTLKALARQYFNYGRGKTSALKKHPASIRLRQIVAPCFVGALIGALPVSVLIPSTVWLWLLVLALYLIMNLAFSLATASRAGYRLFWRVALVFPTIHVSWGLGFWAGLLFGDMKLAHRRAASTHLSLSKEM
jgi:glycosyltransferase involved in cell wall biosynthesis